MLKLSKTSILALAIVANLSAQALTDAKGIFLDGDEKAPPALKMGVVLKRGSARPKNVPTSYKFLDGDKMKFQFAASKDAYVYVLHRTVEASGSQLDRYSGAKGIELIDEDDRRGNSKQSYQLLFPNQRSGKSNLVKSGEQKSVPIGESAYFTMDDQPGMEKLIVVMSKTKLDITDYFDVATGKLRGRTERSEKPRKDSDADVLGQLTRKLMDYSGNVMVSSAKGIDVVDDFAAPKKGDKPIVVTVDLKHASR